MRIGNHCLIRKTNYVKHKKIDLLFKNEIKV